MSFEPIFKKSYRAKNLIIRITSESMVIVTMPYGIPIKTAQNFVESKRDWIKKRLDDFMQDRELISFKHQSEIPYFDGKLVIEILNTKVAKTKVFIHNSKILVFVNKHTKDTVIKNSIIKALKKDFRKHINRIIGKVNANNYFKYKKIAIKDNRTNWGSCSAKGNLNFNWRLIFAPEKIVEYVVIHELCHLREHNHSKAFWNLVETFCPDFEEGKTWLRQKGHKLSLK